MKKLADEKGLPLQACHVGSMFGYFSPKILYQTTKMH